MGVMCAACAKGSSTLNNNGEITENMSGTTISGAETSKGQNVETEFLGETQTETPQETESEAPKETIVEYELNTVESLEDDGKEMSAAEAFRSTMKGNHSALELLEEEKMYSLTNDDDGWNQAEEVKDMPDTGLARINMLSYNRGGIGGAITPVTVKWEKFMCVDLDGNGTKEVLVYNIGLCAVLHYAGNEVYMTNINSKTRPDIIYENGVWGNGPNVFTEAYYKLYPAKGAIYEERLAYQYVVSEDMNPINNKYEVMNKEVTKEEHDAYLEGLIGGLTPLEWHEFTEENIDKYVVD